MSCINKSLDEYKILKDAYGDFLAESIVRSITEQQGKQEFIIPTMQQAREYLDKTYQKRDKNILDTFKKNPNMSFTEIRTVLQNVIYNHNNTYYINKGGPIGILNKEYQTKDVFNNNLNLLNQLEVLYPDIIKIIPVDEVRDEYEIKITPKEDVVEKQKEEISLNETNKKIENFLKQFGFTTRQLDDLKNTTGYSIIGATDFLEKIIFVQKENIDKAYTKEAAYVIFNLLGRKNLLRKDLIASIHLIENYDELKSKYINSELSDYNIRELIAVDYLRDKLIEAHKETLETDNKAVSKDVTAKNKLQYIILKIKQWWSNIIRKFFKSYKRGYIENVFNQTANDIINNNTRLFNLPKNIPYKKMELTSKFKEINDSFVELGAIVAGSYALNRQGNLTRESINDLDFFIPYEIKDDFVKNVIKKYPQAVFSKPYSGVMGGRRITLSLTIDGVKIDLFFPTSQLESDKNFITIIDNVPYLYWKNIFDAKVRIGSKKHLSDLAGFVPFSRDYFYYNTSYKNPINIKARYLDIAGQRHYSFDFIQSKYNKEKYSTNQEVIKPDVIIDYSDKNIYNKAISFFKENNINFEDSFQYKDLLSYFKNDEKKAVVAYFKTFSVNFKKFYGLIDSRKEVNDFIINNTSGNYSKNSILLDENNEPVIFYHGAGTIFDKFSKDYFLSGEGAMAYGAGFYSTNYKPTADNYRDAAKSAMNTFNKLLQEQNQQLLDLISKLKIDINENTLTGFMMGSLDVEDSKSKAKLLNLLGLTETKALYISLTNPLYWQKDISKENKNLIESYFDIKLKNTNSGQIYRELEKTLKISDKELSARLYQIGIDGVINIAGGGRAVGGFSHKKGEKHVIFFEPIQAKAVNNSGLFSLNNENMYDPIDVENVDNIQTEEQENIFQNSTYQELLYKLNDIFEDRTSLIFNINNNKDFDINNRLKAIKSLINNKEVNYNNHLEHLEEYLELFGHLPPIYDLVNKYGSKQAVLEVYDNDNGSGNNNLQQEFIEAVNSLKNIFKNVDDRKLNSLENWLDKNIVDINKIDIQNKDDNVLYPTEQYSLDVNNEKFIKYYYELSGKKEDVITFAKRLKSNIATYKLLGYNNDKILELLKCL